MNRALVGGMRAKNNGRYNGNGREWGTPPELYAQLDAEFHFTLDPCATDASAKCATYYTERDNGLEHDVVGHAEVRYLRGRVRWITGGPYRASGFFASVVVIWRPK